MALSFTNLVAQSTVRFDATKTHQHITGFGGFVCSPQFQYIKNGKKFIVR